MKDLKVSAKIFLLSGGIILAFSLLVGWQYQRTSDNLYSARQAQIRTLVEAAWGEIDYFSRSAARGEISLADAQALAQRVVGNQRFDGDNYFWINDLQPLMVMHPLNAELNGRDLANVTDPTGKRLFLEMADLARSKGEGFLSYVWDKPGSSKPVAKISYIKNLPEWGWIIGAGLYIDDIEAELLRIKLGALSALLAVIAIVAVIVVRVSRGISRPLAETVEMIEEMERGRLSRRLNLDRGDEIGRLAKAMDSFSDSLQREVVTPLQKLAEGDVTFTVVPRDGHDVLRGSLKRLGDDLNALLRQIQTSGQHIAAGAVEVADGSQSLAQGATEQASSLEEISASMQQIGTQTRMNAANAVKANELSHQSQALSQEGDRRMQAVVSAMEEIRDAGQRISKIIRSIDDIAFQTNLLALNAAVEAARAGQHGKGFAVVAEEVRNLAARTSIASRETAELIAGAVEKTENGSQLAHQSAAALAEIVGGITATAKLVTEIAVASNEQAEAIGQINVGLSQIDQVTLQTTANAEESAAAAEELSGQADCLRQLLARFRLRA